MAVALVTKQSVLSITAKEEQGNAVLAIHFTVKPLNQLYITKTESFSFKSGRAMWVTEVIKEDHPVLLQ